MFRLVAVLFFLFSSGLSAHAQTRVLVHTTLGDFTLEMREDLAPITAGNFIGLVEEGFYDGIIFHRIIDGFVVQGGDPTGTGSGGSGDTIPDEFSDSLSNVARTISMANSGPNTGTSQFFINLVNNTYLDYDNPPLTSAHPVFGRVVEGWDTVLAIGNVPVDSTYRPLTPVVMDSVRLESTVSPVGALAANIRGYRLQPNPVNAGSWLELTLDQPEAITLQVLDAVGKAAGEPHAFNAAAGSTRIALDALHLASLAPGSYFMMIRGQRGDVRVLAFQR